MSRTSPKCIVKRKKMEKGKISECPVIKFSTKFSSVKRISFKKDGHVVYFYITQQKKMAREESSIVERSEKKCKTLGFMRTKKKMTMTKALNDV